MKENISKLSLRQIIKTSQKTILSVKLSQLLSLKEQDIIDIFTKIENDAIFQKLSSVKVIKKIPFSKTDPFRSYQEFKEEIFNIDTNEQNIISKILENEKIIQLIKNIGEENYHKYFLSDEYWTLENIAEQLKIKYEEAKDILDFTNSVLIYSEIQKKNINVATTEKRYIKYAKLEISNGEIQINYLMPSMFRGKYLIDYELLQNYIENTSKQEKEQIKNIIENLEFINIRRSNINLLFETLVCLQKEFLLTDLWERRYILTQRDLAKILDLDTSIICRIVYNKSIVSPNNIEYPLTDLIPNKKEMTMIFIQDILNSASVQKKLTDEKIKSTLKEKYDISASRRSITYYRNKLNIFRKKLNKK